MRLLKFETHYGRLFLIFQGDTFTCFFLGGESTNCKLDVFFLLWVFPPSSAVARQEGVAPVSSWWLSWRSSLVWDETHATDLFRQRGTGWWWLRPAKHLEWRCANEKHVVEYWGAIARKFFTLCFYLLLLSCWSEPVVLNFWYLVFWFCTSQSCNGCDEGQSCYGDFLVTGTALGCTEHSPKKETAGRVL